MKIDSKALMRIAPAAIAVALLPSSLWAQVQSPAPAPVAAPILAPTEAGPTGGPGLQEIVVTAQRKSENIQDVPIAVSALTAEMLGSSGIGSTQDLTTIVPGLVFAQNLGEGTPFIRGVGSSSNQPGQESPVSLYFDGVYLPASSSSILDFNNIERIEVLRGPQGTLFGRNSSGGVIQVITQSPSLTKSTFEGSVGYGNFNSSQATIHLSTPLTSNLSFDVAGLYRYQGDGYGRDSTTGADYDKGKSSAVNSKLYWEPGDHTKISLGVTHTDSNSDYGLGYVADLPANASIGCNNINADVTPKITRTFNLISLTAVQDLSGMKLTSISAYQIAKSDVLIDADGTPIDLLNAGIFTDEKFSSQELQLSSDSSSRLSWTTGLFYWHANAFEHRNLFGLAYGAPEALFQTNGRQTTNSYAAYTQGTYKLGTSTSFTAGVRYTLDDKAITGFDVNSVGSLITKPADFHSSDSVAKLTWRLALDHHFSDSIMGYVSYNRGFKSGSFNVGEPFDPATKPETLDTYESGLKSTLLDGRARVNLAAYYYKYSNLQVLSVDATGTAVLENASNAIQYGLEGELTLVLTPNFRIEPNFSWTPKADYEDYANATVGGGAPFNASGFRIDRDPEFTGGVAADYTIPTASGNLVLNGNYYYNSGYYAEVNHALRQPSYSIVNATVAWHLPGDHLTLQLWGKDLANEHHYADLITIVYPTRIAAAPRTFGVQMAFKF